MFLSLAVCDEPGERLNNTRLDWLDTTSAVSMFESGWLKAPYASVDLSPPLYLSAYLCLTRPATHRHRQTDRIHIHMDNSVVGPHSYAYFVCDLNLSFILVCILFLFFFYFISFTLALCLSLSVARCDFLSVGYVIQRHYFQLSLLNELLCTKFRLRTNQMPQTFPFMRHRGQYMLILI